MKQQGKSGTAGQPSQEQVRPPPPPARSGPVTDDAHQRIRDRVVDFGQSNGQTGSGRSQSGEISQKPEKQQVGGVEQHRHAQGTETPAEDDTKRQGLLLSSSACGAHQRLLASASSGRQTLAIRRCRSVARVFCTDSSGS